MVNKAPKDILIYRDGLPKEIATDFLPTAIVKVFSTYSDKTKGYPSAEIPEKEYKIARLKARALVRLKLRRGKFTIENLEAKSKPLRAFSDLEIISEREICWKNEDGTYSPRVDLSVRARGYEPKKLERKVVRVDPEIELGGSGEVANVEDENFLQESEEAEPQVESSVMNSLEWKYSTCGIRGKHSGAHFAERANSHHGVRD